MHTMKLVATPKLLVFHHKRARSLFKNCQIESNIISPRIEMRSYM